MHRSPPSKFRVEAAVTVGLPLLGVNSLRRQGNNGWVIAVVALSAVGSGCDRHDELRVDLRVMTGTLLLVTFPPSRMDACSAGRPAGGSSRAASGFATPDVLIATSRYRLRYIAIFIGLKW